MYICVHSRICTHTHTRTEREREKERERERENAFCIECVLYRRTSDDALVGESENHILALRKVPGIVRLQKKENDILMGKKKRMTSYRGKKRE
jgi:hypothetical protein